MWYVIQVRTGYETEIAEECRMRAACEGEDIFVITSERMMRQKDGTWEEKQQSAFPGYIFAETDDAEGLYIRLRQVKTMTKILTVGDEIHPIYPEEEELLKKLSGEDHCIRVSKGFKAGDRLVVTDGPMKGYEGMVKWVKTHRKVAAIEVELLGQKIAVKLGFEFLREA